MTESVLEKIRELREQEAAIIDKAKIEAIRQAESAVGLLNELGFDYRFIKHVEGRTKEKKSTRKRGASPDGPCKICGFKTAPLHDARHHKSQGTDKRPFTGAELQEKGLMKIGERIEQQGMALVVHSTLTSKGEYVGMAECHRAVLWLYSGRRAFFGDGPRRREVY